MYRYVNRGDIVGKRIMKKQKPKKNILRFFVFGSTCIVLSIFITMTISKLWTKIYSKYKEKKELTQKIEKLKKEEEDLALNVEKMQDPEYVARYLREKYFYSKKDEYIIRIPEK